MTIINSPGLSTQKPEGFMVCIVILLHFGLKLEK